MLRYCKNNFFGAVTIALPLFAVIVLSSCSMMAKGSDDDDCGFSAYYVAAPDGDTVDIIFSRVMAEERNGRTNCGFGYVKTKVDQAQIDGRVLPEQKRDRDYIYTAPSGFDPRKNTILIKVGDRLYTSDLATVRQTDKNVYISLKSKN